MDNNLHYNVFLDTTVFDNQHYQFDKGNLSTLSKYAKKGIINVYISDIVYREALKHYEKESIADRDNAKSIIKRRNMVFSSPVSVIDDKEIKKLCEGSFQNYVEECNIAILKCDDLKVKPIVDKYFNNELPFEDKKDKKNEFPDAISAEEILKRFDGKENLIIISSDTGFCQTFSSKKYISSLPSLNHLFDLINKDNELYDTAKEKISLLKDSIIDKIKYYVLDNSYNCLELNGMSCDKDGITNGYDYEETELNEIDISNISLHFVNEISDDYITVVLKVSSKMKLSGIYFDESDSCYDSEIKDYLFISKSINNEIHETRFPCSVRINKDNSIKVEDVHIYLGESTRIKRIVDVDRYEYINS